MTPQQFNAVMAPVIDAVAGKPVDGSLESTLNRAFPADGPVVGAIEKACHEAIEAGWMCARGKPGRKYGRVIEATPASRDLSVDVVDLVDIVGPHHVHPNGEVCLVLPVTPAAKFMGNGRGWCCYGAGSDHHPTVSGGRALVLYLLPGGKIEFTGR